MDTLKRPLTAAELAWVLVAVMPDRDVKSLTRLIRHYAEQGLFGERQRIGEGRTAPVGYDLENALMAVAYVWLAEAFRMDAARLATLRDVMRSNLDPDVGPSDVDDRRSALEFVLERAEAGDSDTYLLLHFGADGKIVAGRVTRFSELATSAGADFYAMPSVTLPVGAWASLMFPLSDHVDLDRSPWSGGR